MFSGGMEQKLRISFGAGAVYAEANLLKSVLLNLVDNACKASEAGGLVEVFGKRVPGAYAFCVKDSGVGIPEEELKKVTEAFYMVDKSRSRGKNGAGLGLALCVEILRLHESELTIESTVGKGTSIWFEIPDAEEPAEKTGKAESGEEGEKPGEAVKTETEEEAGPGETVKAETEEEEDPEEAVKAETEEETGPGETVKAETEKEEDPEEAVKADTCGRMEGDAAASRGEGDNGEKTGKPKTGEGTAGGDKAEEGHETEKTDETHGIS